MPDYPVLKPGTVGYMVTLLQQALQRLDRYGHADGIYGPKTTKAVTDFQRDEGLQQDGEAGPETHGRLDELGVLVPSGISPDPTALVVVFKPEVAPTIATVGGVLQLSSDQADLGALNVLLAAAVGATAEPTYGDDPELADLDARVAEVDPTIPRTTDTFTFRLPAGAEPATLAAQLSVLEFVDSASPVLAGSLTARPNDPYLGNSAVPARHNSGLYKQWYAFRCNADAAWETTNGNGTVVAIIDSGFLLDQASPNTKTKSHEDLTDRVNFARSANIAEPTKGVNAGGNDHGTATMGIAGAVGDNDTGITGFSWHSELWALAIQNAKGEIDVAHVAPAINHVLLAKDPRPVVISISASVVTAVDQAGQATSTDILEMAPYLRDAIRRAGALNVPVVMSAGNLNQQIGVQADGTPHPDAGGIVVGGTAPGSDNARWEAATTRGSCFGARVDVCAPADDVTTCGSGGTYTTFGGTSAATPMVAGTVALMRSVHPGLTPAQIRTMLRSTGSTPSTTPARAIGTFLDAGAAVAAALAAYRTGHAQKGWAKCSACDALFFTGSGTLGVCPSTGTTHKKGATAYLVGLGLSQSFAQGDWRWCKDCEALFFAASASTCAKTNGPHDGSASGKYFLAMFARPKLGEDGWSWCKECGCLVKQATVPAVCAGAGGKHDVSASGPYSVMKA